MTRCAIRLCLALALLTTAACDRPPAPVLAQPDDEPRRRAEAEAEGPAAAAEASKAPTNDPADAAINDKPAGDASAAVDSPSADETATAAQPQPENVAAAAMQPAAGEEMADGAAKPGADAEPATVAEPIADATQHDAGYRILTPTTAGPLLVELRIYIGDRPLNVALANFLTERLTAADQDGNGRTRWQEWFDASANYDTTGVPRVEAGQQRDLIRQYDTNRNGHAEADEVARLLARDGGVTAAFALTGTHAFRNRNRTDSALFQLLDRDGDRRLTHQERLAAPERLRLLDQDGDDLLAAGEMAAMQPAGDPPWRRGNAGGRSDTALALSGFTDWSMLGYAVAGMRGSAGASSKVAGFRPSDLIDQLDADGDGAFNRQETQSLQTVPPHLRIEVHLSAPGDHQPPRISLTHWPDALQKSSIDVDAGGRLTLTMPRLRWTLRVEDAAASEAASVWMYQLRGRASERPDALAAWLDGDQDSRLSTREIEGAAERLGEMELAGDAALSTDEIPDAYQVMLIRSNPQQDDVRFSAPPDSTAHRASRPSWATAMDANGDGDISKNEFLADPAQFHLLDVNHDGFLDAVEIQP